MRRRSERGRTNHYQIIFRKAWTIYIENIGQKMSFLSYSDETEITFPFCRSFSTFWNIFRGLCSQVFYSSAWGKK